MKILTKFEIYQNNSNCLAIRLVPNIFDAYTETQNLKDTWKICIRQLWMDKETKDCHQSKSPGSSSGYSPVRQAVQCPT